jgi:hypothetical protein
MMRSLKVLLFIFLVLCIEYARAEQPIGTNEHFSLGALDLVKATHCEKKLPDYDNQAGGDESFDWSKMFSLSANFDTSYRNTQFYKSGYNTVFFQGDSRLEMWLPPFRDNFSWGPYIRFAGITSSHSPAWENVWLAEPGYGLQMYPFSLPEFRNEENNILGKVFGPLRMFSEYNQQDYCGSENTWRPDEQVKAGLDYWKEVYANNIYMPWWTEIWSGLFWQSTSDFDSDYDSTIFASAFRLGIRQPNAGFISNFTPYVLLESSLTENDTYYWENRLTGGTGIRFAPLLYKEKNKPNLLSRFVIFAEFHWAMAYYRDSSPSSVPDYDFRIGINFNIGDWYK